MELSDEEWLAARMRQPPTVIKRDHPLVVLSNVVGILLLAGFVSIIIAVQFGWSPPQFFGQGTQAQPTAQPLRISTPVPVGTTGGGIAVPPLPPCSSVSDTRTACQQDQAPTEAAQPTEEPSPTPPYETACITAPGARPCWLPASQAWEPPVSVPETPVVLLPEATQVPLIFKSAVCQDWHPPMPWPEECK